VKSIDNTMRTETPSAWTGQRVLITGVCGTVGSELLRQLVRLDPSEIVGLDNNESGIFFLMEKHRSDPRVQL
jgi:FlaA1/EpsC-like NDP-sugar epimerase